MGMALLTERRGQAIPSRAMGCDSGGLPAVIMVDATGRTLFSTPAARELCRRHELGLDATPGRISPAVRDRLAAEVYPEAGVNRLAGCHGIDVLMAACVDLSSAITAGGPHYMVFLSRREPERISRSEDSLEELTPCERRIAYLVGQGLRNKQIAMALSISCRTVESHMNTIFQKLHMTHRSQLVRRLMMAAES